MMIEVWYFELLSRSFGGTFYRHPPGGSRSKVDGAAFHRNVAKKILHIGSLYEKQQF
jgi:hypothetical protein